MATLLGDIAATLGRPIPSDAVLVQWTLWIRDARMLIQAQLGDLDDLDQDVLDYVVREAVKAQVLRPDDATQVDVSVDDGRVSRRYTSATGRINIIDEWWTLLGGRSDAFSIRAFGEADDVTVPLDWT